MAENIKVSQLPAASSVDDADIVPIVQGGVTKQATAAQVQRGTTFGKSLTAAADAAAARQLLMTDNAWAIQGSNIYGLGHSIMAGYNLSDTKYQFLRKLSARSMCSSVTNSGISGHILPQTLLVMAGNNFPPQWIPNSSGLVIVDIGLNEVLRQTTSSNFSTDITGYRNGLKTLLRYLSAKEWHGNGTTVGDGFAGVTFNGTWNDLAYTLKQPTSNADSAVISFTSGKTAILVGVLAWSGPNSQIARITGGTTSPSDFDPSSQGETLATDGWQLHILRIPVSTSATSLTLTFPSGLGFFWGWGVPSDAPPHVVLLNDPYPPTNNGGNGNGNGLTNSECVSQMSALNSALSSVCAESEFSGFCSAVDTSSVFLTASNLQGDGLHLNEVGNANNANLIDVVIRSIAPRAGVTS